ncbi:hypothetical protein [Paracoccus thiocyanatus]|uniref:hypothetical protein n=1 Tax=Paracoccus thiocyanatus TaxID=34006 RepID=UPI0011C05C81|nr:hypothetical protein [Paracoccus thiocyanatus]
MFNIRFLAVLAVAALASCGPAVPIVSDYNGDSVKIQMNTLHSEGEEVAKAKALAEATSICQRGHSKKAEMVSSRVVMDYTVEYLFLCLN